VRGRASFFGKKKQKTFGPLVGRVRGWALVYGEAQELMKFFWWRSQPVGATACARMISEGIVHDDIGFSPSICV
jgi:hypothetical protein